MLRRVVLFALTNLLVILTLGILFSILSHGTALGRSLEAGGWNPAAMMLVCLFWGMGGSLISLMISRWAAKFGTGAEVLDPESVSGDERWLVETVHRLARQAGIETMPQVAIYPASELNAFATGPSKNRALVAVSEGLLSAMTKGEIEGVLAHEISHVSNGDMVTLALLQGVVNAFVMFFAWAISLLLSQALRRDSERGEGFGGYFLRQMVYSLAQMALFFAAYLLVIAPFSRWREFRADAGGAEKSGKSKMIAALEALLGRRQNAELQRAEAQAKAQAPALEAFKINGGWSSLTSTHPPLEERIARLRAL